ncbi:MAG: glycosyltransferase family 4 protein, partial [Elusimicrobia bacterium]|nr:glycosyltransferase family 4 protein [Elusimicrobiota bacterium]
LVYPSLYEGFGYPPLEAMACGCPVTASNATSIPEIVGDAGILFDPYNTEEMAQAIEKVLKNPDLRQELVRKGFEQVKKFSWEKTARQTLEVYKKVYNFKK